MHSWFEQLHAGYARVLRDGTAQALETHPGGDAERWNSRQVVEHLILSYRSSSAVFRERLEKGRATQTKPSAFQRLQQFFVFRFGFFPAGRPAPPGVVPAAIPGEALDGNALAAKMREELEAMDALLVVCEERFGAKRFATHQALGPISARQWRRFHAVHGGHHLKQLRGSGVSSSAKKAEIPG
jgi:hypothetical protein